MIAEAPAHPVDGPFASAAVPEDLGALRAQELKAIDRIAPPRNLDRRHPGLVQLLKREDTLRDKAAADRYAWRKPDFDTPLGQRVLRLLNGLFFALATRNHSGDASNNSNGLHARALIGDMRLTLEFSLVGRQKSGRHGEQARFSADLPASTPLCLSIAWPTGLGVDAVWQDGQDGPLESRLSSIAADLIVAGEAAFRRSLAEEIERQERIRQYEMDERRRRLELAQAKRLEALAKSGDMLASADRIRTLVERVRVGAAGGKSDVSASDLAAWVDWATAYADSLDPVLSGEIFRDVRSVSPTEQR